MRMTRAAALHTDINVTPLVDVCLVLLIIFMVVTPLMNGVPVRLPAAATAQHIEHEPLQVTLKEDHTLYVGGDVVRADELSTELQRRRATSDRPLIVRADKTLSYGDVMDVLDACRTAGFSDVGLGARASRPQ